MMNLRKESLEVKNEVIKKLREEFDLYFSYNYNDLYWIENKKVEVRRLKGCLSGENIWSLSNVEFEKKYLEVKEFIESLEYKNFKIEFNKIRNDISLNRFLNVYKEKYNFIDLNFNEYKEKLYYDERVLILKISYIK